MAKVILKLIGSASLKPSLQNGEGVLKLEQELEEKRLKLKEGWGEKYQKRVHDKNKLTAWERLELLADTCGKGASILPINSFVQTGSDTKEAPNAGVITAFVKVHERWCMAIVNDNTVASGSWWPKTPEKIIRAQEIALKLKIPIIYLVDCSGLYLPEQAKSFPGQYGAGKIFKMNSLLSDAGIPQVAGVFGDCIAGGGYMPIISDKVYMTESAYMVIAGAALIQGAKSQNLSSLDIGGPSVHVNISNCADFRVPDDKSAIEKIREEISNTSSSAVKYYQNGIPGSEPAYLNSELASLIPRSPTQSYEIKEAIARLVDDSLFWEFWPNTGHEVTVGIAKISGLYVGIAANSQGLLPHPKDPNQKRPGGILYREGVAKLSAFSKACNDDGIPIIWLQDISGFDVGLEAEKQGLLGYGSNLIYTNSTNQTPMFTVLLRKASGAGYYAMAGLPYDPVLQLSTCLSRLAVMEGKTLAMGAFKTRPGEKEAMQSLADKIESDMDPYNAAANMDTDEIIKLSEIRTYLSCAVECAYQSQNSRRIKNPRIWSLHDLALLDSSHQNKSSQSKISLTRSPQVEISLSHQEKEGNNNTKSANYLRAPLEGLLYLKPSPNEEAFIKVGDTLKPGQTIALIEVMKCFYPIKYEEVKSKIVKKILVKDNVAIKSGEAILEFKKR